MPKSISFIFQTNFFFVSASLSREYHSIIRSTPLRNRNIIFEIFVYCIFFFFFFFFFADARSSDKSPKGKKKTLNFIHSVTMLLITFLTALNTTNNYPNFSLSSCVPFLRTTVCDFIIPSALLTIRMAVSLTLIDARILYTSWQTDFMLSGHRIAFIVHYCVVYFDVVCYLMAYQLSRVIYYQIHPFRTVMVLLSYRWDDKGVHTFPKCICPKVNIIARLEFELAYYNSAVQRFNHYTMRTTQDVFCTQLCDIRYSYLILIVMLSSNFFHDRHLFAQLYGFK